MRDRNSGGKIVMAMLSLGQYGRLFQCLLAGLAATGFGCAHHRAGVGSRVESAVNVLDTRYGQWRLVVFSYGETPATVDCGCVKGDGIEVIIVDSRNGSVVEDSMLEGAFPVALDYSSYGAGVFRYVYYTYDPRAETCEAPFLVEEYQLSQRGAVLTRRRVVLGGEKGDVSQMTQLSAIAADNWTAGKSEEAESALARIRNMGIDQTDDALKVLSAMRTEDVGFQDLLDIYINDLRTVQGISFDAPKR